MVKKVRKQTDTLVVSKRKHEKQPRGLGLLGMITEGLGRCDRL